MIHIHEIKEAVKQLSSEDFSLFKEWLLEFEANQWDQQMEEDIKAGKLDGLVQKTLEDFQAGKCTEL